MSDQPTAFTVSYEGEPSFVAPFPPTFIHTPTSSASSTDKAYVVSNFIQPAITTQFTQALTDCASLISIRGKSAWLYEGIVIFSVLGNTVCVSVLRISC